MPDFENDFKLIENFNNKMNTHYYNLDGDFHTYYAVLLIDGCVDVTTFPRGRIKTLPKNANFLMFKRIIKRNKTVMIELREELEEKVLRHENKKIYEYIKERCVKESA